MQSRLTTLCTRTKTCHSQIKFLSRIFHLKGQQNWKMGRRPKQTFLQRHINSQSVRFSHSVVSDSLWSHELQHTRPPSLSPTPGVHSNPCSLSRWCHPPISSSVVSFSSCPQTFPSSGSFKMSQLFTSGGQSIGVSALASDLPRPRADLL